MPPNDAVLIRRSPDTSPSTDEALPADADSHLQRHGLPAPSMGLAIGRLAAINSTDSPGMGSSAVRGPPVASMPAHSGAPPSLDITEPVSTDASASVPRSDVRAADPGRYTPGDVLAVFNLSPKARTLVLPLAGWAGALDRLNDQPVRAASGRLEVDLAAQSGAFVA